MTRAKFQEAKDRLDGLTLEKGHNGRNLTPDQRAEAQAKFLQTFEQTANITVSARAARVSRTTVYHWLEHNGPFGLAFHQAEGVANDVLEAEAYRRAVSGVEKKRVIFYKGEQVGEETVREYSDLLLIFIMKARMPDKYRETKVLQHTGADGRPEIPLAVLDKIFSEADLERDD